MHYIALVYCTYVVEKLMCSLRNTEETARILSYLNLDKSNHLKTMDISRWTKKLLNSPPHFSVLACCSMLISS